MRVVTTAATAAAIVVFSGCAQIPGTESTLSDTRATAPRSVSSTRRPADFARCIAQNAEKNVGVFSPAIVPGVSPEVFEVRVRSEVGIAAIVEILPRPEGSISSVHVSNHYIGRKDKYAARLIAGC